MQLQREKVNLEQALEAEEELIVNKLQKQLQDLQEEKGYERAFSYLFLEFNHRRDLEKTIEDDAGHTQELKYVVFHFLTIQT